MKKILIPAAIVLTALIILCCVPIQWNVFRIMPAQVVENVSDGSIVESEITVEGKYYFHLLKPDRFEGKIEIAAFPETTAGNVDFEVSGTVLPNLIYRSWSGSKLNSEFFGLIKANFGMKQMIVFKSDENGGIHLDGEQTCVILAGDAKLEGALALLKDLQTEK